MSLMKFGLNILEKIMGGNEMLEDKILNEWIPDLQRKFQEFMPPIDEGQA